MLASVTPNSSDILTKEVPSNSKISGKNTDKNVNAKDGEKKQNKESFMEVMLKKNPSQKIDDKKEIVIDPTNTNAKKDDGKDTIKDTKNEHLKSSLENLSLGDKVPSEQIVPQQLSVKVEPKKPKTLTLNTLVSKDAPIDKFPLKVDETNYRLRENILKNKASGEVDLREALNLRRDKRSLGDVLEAGKELNITKLSHTKDTSKRSKIFASKSHDIHKDDKDNLKDLKTSKIDVSKIDAPLNSQKQLQENGAMALQKQDSLQDLLKQSKAQDGESLKVGTEEIKEKKKSAQKAQDVNLTQQQKIEIDQKVAQAKDMMKYFGARLKDEIANYKPPLSKLSMELNPKELGTLEVTITKQGKDLQVSVSTNNSGALQTFMQNQIEFKNTLLNTGFQNVELSFSQGESSNKDQSNKQGKQEVSVAGLGDEGEVVKSMEILIPQYA